MRPWLRGPDSSTSGTGRSRDRGASGADRLRGRPVVAAGRISEVVPGDRAAGGTESGAPPRVVRHWIDGTAPRTLDVGGGSRTKRHGPLQGGWLGEHDAPEETRGSRAARVGHPGAWGERRDSGFWMARRSPARASVAGSPPGKQVRKQWPISARVSVPALPRMRGPAFSRQLDAEGSHRFAAPTGHRFPRTPGKGDGVKVEGESSPAASREATCGLCLGDLARAPPAPGGVGTAGIQGPAAFEGGR